MKIVKLTIAALVLMLGTAFTGAAQTADELIQKHLDAIGGVDNWKKVNTMKREGSITAGGTEIQITMSVINKKAMRMDMSIMGMNNYLIVTENEGWQFFPIQGQKAPEAMTADQVKESVDQLDIQGELVDYKTKGTKVELVGKDEVEGTETFKMKLTTKGGNEKTLYFDASNYYLIREVQKVVADGKTTESSTSFSNYQKLPEGITVAMAIDSDNGPIKFKSILINPKLDEAIFKPTN